AGSMTNWATDKEAMTLDEQTGKFSITRQMEAGAEFKFIDQDGAWIGGDADGNFVVQRDQVVNGTELTLLLNAGNNFQIPVAGTWTLTVDKQTMKLVVSGNWPAPKYAVVVAECDHGTVDVDKEEAEEGETVTITPTPDPGCELTSLEVIVGANTPVETYYDNETEQFTFEMPAESVSVVAVFDYTVDAITLAQALTQPEGTEVRISDELLIATVEPDGVAILTDNNGNWIASQFDNDVINALVNLTPPAMSIKAGSLQGVITNTDTNPELELSFAPEAGESFVDYTPMNIDLTQPIDVPGNCIATVSGYYADGKLRAYSNIEDPGQMLTIDNTYVGSELDDTRYVNHKVSLKVIVKLNSAWEPNEPAGDAPRRVHKDDGNSASNYTIVPLTGSVGDDIVTGVEDLRMAETGTVTYVNVMGQTSNRPFNGVNIVVNADGTVTKVVK
ncbi:MAG: hypothetical protein IKR25_02325, partial [Muribaculaceae bacterium]|nr:hypothetical protein [Muribaculaceae bacterium]